MVKSLMKNQFFPFKDESINYVYSSHFIEHVVDDVVDNFLNESFRILKKEWRYKIVTLILKNYMKYY